MTIPEAAGGQTKEAPAGEPTQAYNANGEIPTPTQRTLYEIKHPSGRIDAAQETPPEEDRTKIIDEGEDRRYRTEIPNLLFEMGLSAYALLLYCYYKRVAGAAKGGECFQSTRTIAQRLSISTGSVTNARRELEEKGLIEAEEPERKGLPYTVRIVNIWKKNAKHFDRSARSSQEQGCAPHAQECAAHARKKEPSKKDSAKAGEASSPPGSAFEFMRHYAPLRKEAMPLAERERGKLASALQRRLDAGDDPKKLHMAMCRMVTRRMEGQRLKLEDAINDIGGAGRPPTRNGDRTSTTDEAAVAALEDHAKLRRYAYLAAEHWDFARDEDPPEGVMKRLGGTREEASCNLKRIRSVTRKALRDRETM